MSQLGDTGAAWPMAADRGAVPWPPTVFALATLALRAGYIAQTVSLRQAELFLVGAGAGVVLYHAAFGFTSSWRIFIVEGRGDGVRAQMLMLAATCWAQSSALSSVSERVGRRLLHGVAGRPTTVRDRHHGNTRLRDRRRD